MSDVSQSSSDNSSSVNNLSDSSFFNMDSVNDSLLLVNQFSDGLLEDVSLFNNILDCFRSNWFWNWSTDSSDGSLDVNDLMDEFLNDLSEVNNLLFDNNSSWSLWDGWKSMDKMSDGLLDLSNSSDDLVNLLLESMNNVSFFWS